MTDVATPAPPIAAPANPPAPAAPAPIAAPAAPPAAPAPPAPDAADPGDGSLPKWVAARLEQAKRSAAADVLRAIGAETPEAAADAVKRARAAADAEKTAAQQAAEAQQRAATLQKERDDLHTTVGTVATAQLSALTAEQRAAVTAIAGDNPAAQLRTIAALRPTWTVVAPPAAAPAPAAPAPPAAPPPPPAPPANTAPQAGAPPAGSPPAVTDHLAVLKGLEVTNPIRAARYRTTYAGEIAAATKARGSV